MAEAAVETTQKPRKADKKHPAIPNKFSAKPFPAPPKPKNKGGNVAPDILFEYARAIPAELVQSRYVMYVNREWPVLNHLQALTPEELERVHAKKLKVPKYIDKLSAPFESDDWRMEILRRYGSGDYKVFVNDSGVLGAKHEAIIRADNLCRTVISLRDDEFPPVLDLRLLDMKDPRNESYIQSLRLKGVDLPGSEKETEMNNEVVKTLVDKVGDLSDRVATQETDRLVDRIAEKVGGNNNGGNTVLETIKAVKEILPAPTPATDNGLLTTIVTLMTKQIESSQAEAKELRQEVRDMRNHQNGGAFSIEKIVEGANKLMPLVKEIWPAAKDASERFSARPVRSNMSGWMEFLQPAIPAVLNSPIWGAIAQGMLMKSAAQQQQNGMPIQPIPALNPSPQPQPTNPNQGMIEFLQEIARPMINHVSFMLPPNDSDPAEVGEEFAKWVYDGYASDPRYDQAIGTARMMGVASLIGLYKQSPWWGRLGANEIKFTAFVEAMLAWNPPADDDDDGVIDLSQESAIPGVMA